MNEDYKKLYKQALKRAKYLKENTDSVGALDVSTCFEEIFPELRESEDERIKRCIQVALTDVDENRFNDYDTTLKDCIAWLEKQRKIAPTKDELEALRIAAYEPTKNWSEKIQSLYEKLSNCVQGEQKPVDKVESKFNVGDWITNGEYIWFIEGTHNSFYDIISPEGFRTDDTIIYVDEHFHLWTIQDAKKGDVLYCKKDDNLEIIVMYLGINKHNNVDSYCRYNSKLGFNTYITNVLSAEFDFITPATKEQCNILLSKMKEAGYEWDADKKELKKIEQNSKPISPKFKIGDIISDGTSEVEIINVDENKYHVTNGEIENDANICNWVVYLKDQEKWKLVEYKSCGKEDKKHPQQKQEWSEEDKSFIEDITNVIIENYNILQSDKERMIDWLKSLKPRWKPSEQNIKDLEWCVDLFKDKMGVGFHRLQVFIDEIKKL